MGDSFFKKSVWNVEGDSFFKNSGADGQIVRPRRFAFIKILGDGGKAHSGGRGIISVKPAYA